MSTAICIASGPSLTKEDVDFCRGKGRVYVVNDCYRLAPWANVLYACDGPWWNEHKGAPGFNGEKWTLDFQASRDWRLNLIPHRKDISWSNNPEWIATGGHKGGGNSGFQVLNLAAIQGAQRIILLGYDMGHQPGQKSHWFGEHPDNLVQGSNYGRFADAFKAALPEIKQHVINCSRASALECFERARLEDVFC